MIFLATMIKDRLLNSYVMIHMTTVRTLQLAMSVYIMFTFPLLFFLWMLPSLLVVKLKLLLYSVTNAII